MSADRSGLDASIGKATQALLDRQLPSGEWLFELEADCTIPSEYVLLRHYLKLNARAIGFNIDPDFGDALDALMMVDLATVSQSVLTRYLGKDTAAAFLAKHLTAAEPHRAA